MNAIPMTTATLLTGIPEFVVAELGDRALRRAYSDAGLHHGARATAGWYLPESALFSMMESAARQAGEETLGALFGTHVNLGLYDTWGPYILEAPTLDDSLRRFQAVMRYVASHSRGGLSVTGQQARLGFRWGGRKPVGYRQTCLATAGSLLNTIRLYLGPGFLPDEIHLDIARPIQASLIETHLPTRVFYEAEEISLRFPQNFLSAPRHDPQIMRPITLSDVRRRVLTGPPRDIKAVVTELVRFQVVNGGPSLDQTTRALNMNERTLRRALDRYGEGFREIAQRIRLETAEELLRETDMPVRKVSETVGYSDPYNFSRAYYKNYGIRPAAVRCS